MRKHKPLTVFEKSLILDARLDQTIRLWIKPVRVKRKLVSKNQKVNDTIRAIRKESPALLGLSK